MFRTSLRAVSDPLRDHVCFACLARRIETPIRPLLFYRTYSSRPEPGEDGLEAPPQPTDSSIRLPAKTEDKLPKLPPKEKQSGVPKQNTRDHPVGASTPKAVDEKRDVTQEEPAPSSMEGGSDSANKANKKRRKKKAAEDGAKKEVAKPKKNLVRKCKVRPGPNSEDRTVDDGAVADSSPKPSPEGTSRILNYVQLAQKTPASALAADADDTAAKTALRRKQREERLLTHLSRFVSAKQNGSFDAKDLKIAPLDVETAQVPGLSFGLERVLFNPGVYHLRDPRSRVYNFDPYLGSIMPVTEFDFDALKEYITSSRDETLRNMAAEQGKKYVGSSSSMTSVLSHFHYLLSSWRPVNTSTVSQGFPDKLRSFTRLLRAPAAMFLRYRDGAYAIDADKEFDTANILMNLGKSMEKLLTLPKEEFERYRRSSTNKISAEEEQAAPEAYHYSTLGNFIMRSQLDAHDPRLPGTGMFDLKTRAVVSIRMDASHFEHGLGYEIKHRYGAFESYEREYYDMIRAAFLKYSLQVRVGRMDGIFVAFHNIERIFGFQYVSLPEMDQALHGQTDTSLGDTEFRLSLGLWNMVLDKATAKFPGKSLRLHFETRDAQVPFMYIFAEPVTDDEIHAIQTRNKEEIEEYQRRILNLGPARDADSPAEIEALDPESDSELNANDASAGSPSESPAEQESSSIADEEFLKMHGIKAEEPARELLTMALTVRNFVNGKLVERPSNFAAHDKWTVEYELSEMQEGLPQMKSLYEACQKRRKVSLEGRGEDETDLAANVYIRKLREISKQGRKWRAQENKVDKARGTVVLTDPIPRAS